MLKTLRVIALAVLVVGLGSLAAADSHEETPPVYVWASFVTAQPGQGEALTALLMEDAELYDPLIESGAVLEWGIGMPVVHDGGDSGIRVQWATFVGWAGADQFMKAFSDRMQAMGPDQMKEMGEKWNSVVVPGSHRDMINRTVHIGSQEIKRPAYIHLDYRTAKPGKMNAATAFYKNNVAPVYEKVLADGKILNYGLHVPAVQRGQGWTHMGWSMSSGLASRDAVGAAFDAMFAGLSEEDRKAWMDGLMGVLEPGYEQQIIMVVHHNAAGGGQEGEE